MPGKRRRVDADRRLCILRDLKKGHSQSKISERYGVSRWLVRGLDREERGIEEEPRVRLTNEEKKEAERQLEIDKRDAVDEITEVLAYWNLPGTMLFNRIKQGSDPRSFLRKIKLFTAKGLKPPLHRIVAASDKQLEKIVLERLNHVKKHSTAEIKVLNFLKSNTFMQEDSVRIMGKLRLLAEKHGWKNPFPVYLGRLERICELVPLAYEGRQMHEKDIFRFINDTTRLERFAKKKELTRKMFTTLLQMLKTRGGNTHGIEGLSHTLLQKAILRIQQYEKRTRKQYNLSLTDLLKKYGKQKAWDRFLEKMSANR